MRLIRNAVRLLIAMGAVALWSFVAIPAVAHDLPRLAFAVSFPMLQATAFLLMVFWEDAC